MDEQALFEQAVAIGSAAERSRFLETACAGRPDLKQRIEQLVRLHEDAGSFLEKPPEGLSAAPGATPTEDAATRLAPSSTLGRDALSVLTPTDKPGLLGTIGQYEVESLLGRGGMGLVFQARDTKLSRTVAVKVLAPELAAHPTARKRFLREALATAAVSHPHVVTIHAVDEELPYLVMEYIDGRTLQDKIDRQGMLELKEILRIGSQIAQGLAAAHKQGLIHRDIKPANVLLENGVERVKITDFGLARAADDLGMTRTGEVAGTPQYMSPEQAHGETVDHRSDLFSLGSVLYAMCTGRSPFRAETPMAAIRRVCDDTPRPIRDVNPDIPDWLAAIVERLLEKRPEDRFQSAAEVADLLAQHLAHLQHPATSPAPAAAPSAVAELPQRGRGRLKIAAVALLIAAGTFAALETFGVTNVSETVIAAARGRGTLEVRADDPQVEISIAGEGLSITARGAFREQVRTGKYEIETTKRLKDGRLVREFETVTVSRGRQTTIHPSFARYEVADYEAIAQFLADGAGATLTIDVEDPTLDVAFNGQFWQIAGEGPQTITVRPGQYQIRGIRRGLHVFEQTITMKAGDRRSLTFPIAAVTLAQSEPAAQGKPPTAGTTPPGLQVPPSDVPEPPPAAIAPFDPAAAQRQQQEWANYLGLPVEYPNSIGMTFRLVPPGEFLMGFSADRMAELEIQLGQQNAGDFALFVARSSTPQHRVRLTKPYYISVHEVTVAQFRRFVESKQYRSTQQDPETGRDRWESFVGGDDAEDRPVMGVTWDDADAFCRWLSKTEHVAAALPTEAQWEFACRAGSRSLWSFGDDREELPEYAVTGPRGEVPAGRVGSKRPNPFGLFDMHGNAAEWCRDWHRTEAYSLPQQIDPVILDFPTDPNSGRVVRGGSSSGDEWSTYSSMRSYDFHRTPTGAIGFRVVVEIDPAALFAERAAVPTVEEPEPFEAPYKDAVWARLVSRAAGIPLDEWTTLAGDVKGPPAAAVRGEPLSYVLLMLDPFREARRNQEVVRDFWYLTETLPKPQQLARALERSRSEDYVSFIQPQFITHLQIRLNETPPPGRIEFLGDVGFSVPKLYSGRAEFRASRSALDPSDPFEIVEFRLPAYGITVVRNDQGTWERAAAGNAAEEAPVEAPRP